MKAQLLIVLMSFCFPLLLTGQSSIQVYVVDESDQPIDAQTLVLKNDQTGLEMDGLTNADGLYTFKNLPEVSGYEIISVENPQFQSAAISKITLRSNEEKFVELQLKARGSVELEEVTVRASNTHRINRRNAEVAFELDNTSIQQIPIEGRDITRVLYRLPNVSQATGFYPEAPNVSINGANPLYTSYLIDGMDNNERFLGGQKFAIPTGFTQNITLLTNNYSAEYGLAGNGVINITSKSGSNEFSGEAFAITRPGGVIDGDSRFPQRDLSGNLVNQDFQRYQTGVGFGGAIVPDQTFYYFNVEHITDLKQNVLSSPDLGVVANVPGQNRFTYISGKIDHIWSKNFRSSLRFNQGLVNIQSPGGGLDGGVTFPSAGLIQDQISTHVALKNTYHTDRFSAQTNLQYSRYRWNYSRPNQEEGLPQVTVLAPSEQVAAVLGHPGFVFDQFENTLQWQQKLSFYMGNHTLKIGGGIISGDHTLFGGGNPNGNYTVKLSEGQIGDLRNLNRGTDLTIDDIPSDVEVLNYNVELRPNSFGARQTIYSFYIEDHFRVSHRLNLTAGLRYDYDDLTASPTGQGDLDNIAPRLNLNYKLTDRSVLRAGYGIFYDKIIYAIYSDALQQNTINPDYAKQVSFLLEENGYDPEVAEQLLFNGNLTASVNDADYLDPPSTEELQSQRDGVFSNERRILSPTGWENPKTHQFSLGYQLQIDENRLFYVDLMHNRSFNLYRLRNLNAPAPFNYDQDPDEFDVRSVSEADATRPTPIATDAEGRTYADLGDERLYGGTRNVVVSETEGESRYYAASFNFQKSRGEDNYSFRINYTLSNLRNNTEDINFRAMDANDFEAEWGPSINDRTHIINSIFTFYASDRLNFTLAALLQSGQPINRIPDGREFGTTDLNGDGAFFGDAYVGNSDRYPGESRNNDRLPWANTFDLSINYYIPFFKNKLELRADVFNIFNAQNLSGYSNNATQSNQVQQGSRASGRLVRRNASAPRQFQFTLRYLW